MKRLARWLRDLADRVDGAGAPQLTGWSWTFELGEPDLRFRRDGRGCPVAYLGDDEYDKAYAEADNPPPQPDWKALAEGRPPYVRPPREGRAS